MNTLVIIVVGLFCTSGGVCRQQTAQVPDLISCATLINAHLKPIPDKVNKTTWYLTEGRCKVIEVSPQQTILSISPD